MASKTLALALIAAGLLLGAARMTGMLSHPFAFVAALLFLLLGVLLLRTSPLAGHLRPWLGRKVEARVWGAGLPGYEAATFQLHRAMALGPGIHLYLLPPDSRKALHLKVAQPQDMVLSDGGVEIGTAKYIQWCGKKIKPAQGEKALRLSLRTKSDVG